MQSHYSLPSKVLRVAILLGSSRDENATQALVQAPATRTDKQHSWIITLPSWRRVSAESPAPAVLGSLRDDPPAAACSRVRMPFPSHGKRARTYCPYAATQVRGVGVCQAPSGTWTPVMALASRACKCPQHRHTEITVRPRQERVPGQQRTRSQRVCCSPLRLRVPPYAAGAAAGGRTCCNHRF